LLTVVKKHLTHNLIGRKADMRIGSIEITPLSAMLIFIPICVVLEVMHADPAWIFITAGLGIIPLAGLMGTATEHLAEHYGAGIGGLLNATFGNAAELIIGLVALQAGLLDACSLKLVAA